MGESERYISRRIRRMDIGEDNNALMALIAINAMVFVCFGMVKIIYLMSQSTVTAFNYEVLRYAVLPAKLSSLAYVPWTVITFMFVHSSIIVVIVNLLWLWAFGSILQNIAGNKVVIPVYFYGGFVGAVFFVAAAYIVPSLHSQIEYLSLVGANGSIFAVAMAATTLTPKYRLFPMLNGGIPLWVVTVVFAVITFSSGNRDQANLISYSGGALAGFLFMNSYRKGRNWGLWMNELYSWFINLFEPDRRNKPRNIKNTIFYKTGPYKPFTKETVITQEKIDSLLDKINREGYDNLTDEEKSILSKASKENF